MSPASVLVFDLNFVVVFPDAVHVSMMVTFRKTFLRRARISADGTLLLLVFFALFSDNWKLQSFVFSDNDDRTEKEANGMREPVLDCLQEALIPTDETLEFVIFSFFTYVTQELVSFQGRIIARFMAD